MPRYGIATILDDHPTGYVFAEDNLPLHLTQVDSFEVDMNVQELAAKLRLTLKQQRPFTLKTLDDELWGPEKDILVTTVGLTPELARLHAAIMDVLDAAGATLKNPHFHRDNFAPHISVYGNRRIPVGETVVIKDIAIAAKLSDVEDAGRKILATIPFNAG